MEKLWQLHADGAFDLVVIDTPPSRNALDFLDAPDRLSRFIDHRLFRLMTLPTRGAFRAVSLAAQAFVRTITKVVGGEVVSDVLAFLTAFEGMEQGFRDRATAVRALMEDEATAFVLVASPRRDTVVEALFFAQKLREAGIRVRSLVVNRVHPGVGLGLPSVPPAPAGSALAALEENLAALDSVAAREREHLGDLTAAVAPAPVVLVPFLASDVHDVEGLGEIAAYLLGETSEVTSYRTAG